MSEEVDFQNGLQGLITLAPEDIMCHLEVKIRAWFSSSYLKKMFPSVIVLDETLYKPHEVCFWCVNDVVIYLNEEKTVTFTMQ